MDEWGAYGTMDCPYDRCNTWPIGVILTGVLINNLMYDLQKPACLRL